MRKSVNILFAVLITPLVSVAHPSGNMVVVNEYIIWTYVTDFEAESHTSSVLMWKEGAGTKEWFSSEYSSSDFYFFPDGDEVYILESRYLGGNDEFRFRLLKGSPDETPKEIWPWFNAPVRVGGNGNFMMKSETEMIFHAYPNLYLLSKNGTPKKIETPFREPIEGMRFIDKEMLLLRFEDEIVLVNQDFDVFQHWENLLFDEVKDPPLFRNSLFDMALSEDELLIAYWGNRTFDLIKPRGERKELVKVEPPLAPHWVTFFRGDPVLFSSTITFDGENPKPHLVRYQHGKIDTLWTTEL